MLVDGFPLGRLEHDGDVWRVERIEQAGERYAICRCGTSSSMPLCDRPAPYGCFDEQPATGPEPAPYRWDVPDPAGPPALALKPDGPVRVAGNAAITYGDRELPPRDRISPAIAASFSADRPARKTRAPSRAKAPATAPLMGPPP